MDRGPELQNQWTRRWQREGSYQQEGLWNAAQLRSGNNHGFLTLFKFVCERRYLPDARCHQLKRQIDEEAVFVGFEEGEIDFQPTYKYDTGSDKWDTR